MEDQWEDQWDLDKEVLAVLWDLVVLRWGLVELQWDPAARAKVIAE